jgi:ElaB/YqjD/DUF883 family membrane-anchored ribosome-binding protein
MTSPSTTPYPTSQSAASTPIASVTDSLLREDPSRLVGRVAQGAHDAVDRAAERAVPAVGHLQRRVAEASDAINRRADEFAEMQEYWMETSRARVRAHPITAVAAAVAFGMLLGRLASR